MWVDYLRGGSKGYVAPPPSKIIGGGGGGRPWSPLPTPMHTLQEAYLTCAKGIRESYPSYPNFTS